MIAAVSIVHNEEDIIGCTVRHLLSQGVDAVYIIDDHSTDGTRDLLKSIPRVFVFDRAADDVFEWVKMIPWIKELSHIAGNAGAEWVIPFDADEYWSGTHGRTISKALSTCTAQKVIVPMTQYFDFDHKISGDDPYTWTKVAYRYAPDVEVCVGNHYCTAPDPAEPDVLELRELKFRGFDHFVAKRKHHETIPWEANRLQAGLVPMTMQEFFDQWEWAKAHRVYDPIPSEFRP